MIVLPHRLVSALCLLVLLLAAPTPLRAADTVVIRIVTDPLTRQPRYDPPLVRIAPGETVVFANRGHVHASRIVPGMHPAQAELWWGQVGEDIEVTFTVPGVYGHKCGGSYALGLVGLIVVGDPGVNLEEARAVQHPPAAARVLEPLFAELAGTD